MRRIKHFIFILRKHPRWNEIPPLLQAQSERVFSVQVPKEAVVVMLRRRPLDLEIKTPHLYMRLLASIEVERKVSG